MSELQTDPAFRGAGQSAGLELWRIENLAPVKQATVNGKFYTGDSYILLSTVAKGSSLSWSIHFWLGSETSQDESGVAAYKSVELDNSLGGRPVEYREVQGSETTLFLSYFKNTGGIEYLPGGIASGFSHVERDVYKTRLLQVKGKRTVRVREVPLAASSLNTGDVFILDAGLVIYVFNGPLANKYEKVKGIEVVTNIKNDERGGRASIVNMDDEPDNEVFWGAFGGKFTVTNPGESDSTVDALPKLQKKLFKLSAGSTPEEVSFEGGKLTKNLLDSASVHLVSASKIYIWVGKGASMADKKEAMGSAVAFIRQNNLPESTAVQRVSEAVETSAFKAEFDLWDPPRTFKPSGVGNTSHVRNDEPVDVAALVNRKAAEDVPVDDGSGALEIWRVEDFKLAEYPPQKYGQFFAGDSYVLLYTYQRNRRDEYIVYFWQGHASTADEKGAAALLAKGIDDKYGGRPVQVRVAQGKEPAHFRQLFKGNMIVHSGGKASGFKNTHESDSYDTDGIALFHVKGSNALNTFGVQVAEKASSLVSADCFVLVTPTSAFVWKGKGSTADEQTVATSIALKLSEDYNGTGGRAVIALEEHSEPEEFWSALGGRGEYAELSEGELIPQEPRLFQASTASGFFKVEEIDDFEQSDLVDDDVMILDTYTQLFVWVGSKSTEEEKSRAMGFAQDYLVSCERDPDSVPICRVRSGEEPIMFTSQFRGWDEEFAQRNVFVDPYEAKLKALAAQLAASTIVDDSTASSSSSSSTPNPKPSEARAAFSAASPGPAVAIRRPSTSGGTKFPVPIATSVLTANAVRERDAAPVEDIVYKQPSDGYFSYEILKGAFPPGIDPAKKEEYLDDAAFSTVFGTDKATFRALPKWKKDAKKKEFGLF